MEKKVWHRINEFGNNFVLSPYRKLKLWLDSYFILISYHLRANNCSNIELSPQSKWRHLNLWRNPYRITCILWDQHWYFLKAPQTTPITVKPFVCMELWLWLWAPCNTKLVSFNFILVIYFMSMSSRGFVATVLLGVNLFRIYEHCHHCYINDRYWTQRSHILYTGLGGHCLDFYLFPDIY